jgi:hypothetical protein
LAPKDYIWKEWGEGSNQDDSDKKSIIDRITSSSIFQYPLIRNYPELFVPGTDHIWIIASAVLQGWSYHFVDSILKSWIERRIQIPKREEKWEKIEDYQDRIQQEMAIRQI